MIPEKIGRYIILSELGRGGMATVYRAKDPNFDRSVAVKILPRTFLHDPQFRVRFEREAKTVAALEHAAIVPVYDFGEDDGQPFIVMRLMTGGSLAEKLETRKLSLDEAVRIMTQISPGLFTAHIQGIIHRDLKPGNILFDQYNDAYLSDFGIARFAEGDSTLTGSRILGTPAYMSPEQIQGNKSLDHRSDLYAMGVLFYQMLVGDTPFQGTTPAKVMMMHIMEPVPNIIASLPNIPKSVEVWLERVLAKDPDDRFSDANEMSMALDAAMRGKAPVPLTKAVAAPTWSEDTTRQSPPVVPSTLKLPTNQMAPSTADSSSAQIAEEIFPTPRAQKSRKFGLPPWVIGLVLFLGVSAIVIFGLIFSGMNGKGPLSMLAPATATKTIELVVVDRPTATLLPSPTQDEVQIPTDDIEALPTPSAIPSTATDQPPTPTTEPSPEPEITTIGGADIIAFLNTNDIWLMNVDGSDLHQLTDDGSIKTNLGWFPDGSAITYISGKCIYYVEVESTRVDLIACFSSSEYVENFIISPDGEQVAISVDRYLYVVPWDLDQLQNARFHSDLAAMSECPSLAPIRQTESSLNIKQMRWSNDGNKIIVLDFGVFQGLSADVIKIFNLLSCDSNPDKTDEIPAFRFTMENYAKTRTIENFSFDGDFQISLVSFTRNDGYGHLYIYNTDLHRGEKITPIDGKCCYRDLNFSPDGRYIIFVYQPYEEGARAQLFYIPYGTVGTGVRYEPIPLPENFFENTRGKPQPILRPAP